MYFAKLRVICFLRMANDNRKKTLPEPFDIDDVAAMFYRLEEFPTEPASKRVASILDALEASFNEAADERLRAQHLARLRRLLQVYEWVYQVAPSTEGPHAFVTASPKTHSTFGSWELSAVRVLMVLIQVEGGVARLRRCEVCERWFYAAARSDKKFCSSKCRQYRYDTDPAVKKRKAETNRKNRQQEQERANKALADLRKLRSKKAF